MPATSNGELTNWRAYLIGGVVTLAVTILGGIGVYYLTVLREPVPTERLVYRLTPVVTFSESRPRVFLQTLSVKNEGSLAAEDVQVAIRYEDASGIRDSSVSFSSGPTASYIEKDSEPAGKDYTIPDLAPGEEFTASFLVETEEQTNPEVFVKSTESLGTSGATGDQDATEGRSAAEDLPASLLLALLLQMLLLAMLVVRRRVASWDNRNNVAFRLLHQGLPGPARKLLQRIILEKGGNALQLSNIALCLALERDFDAAGGYIRAALDQASGRHAHAVALFNQALVQFLVNGDPGSAEDLLHRAIKKSKDIRQYLSESLLVSELRSEKPELDAVLRRLEASPPSNKAAVPGGSRRR